MYTITTCSNRLYIDENIFSDDTIMDIENTIKQFNRLKFTAYNLNFLKELDKDRFDNIVCGNSESVYLKSKFGVLQYFVNSVLNLAKGLVKSNNTNRKNYIKETEEHIKAVEGNIIKTQTQLDNLLELRESFILARSFIIHNKNHWQTPNILTELSKICKSVNFTKDGAIVSIPFSSKKDNYGWFAFEYKYLNPKITNLKNQLSQYKYRLNNLKNKLENLSKPKHSIFGSKRRMKQYTKKELNKKDFMSYKYNSFTVDGRNDSIYGNFVFSNTYNEETNSFDFNIKMMSGNIISISNVKFPYKFKELRQILEWDKQHANKNKTEGKGLPICYSLVRKYDHNNRCYYQIVVTFDIESTCKFLNYNKSTGIIAMDFNYGHIDMTELDGKGNLLFYKTIYYDLHFNSQQNEESLRKALDEVGEYAKSKHKIIAVEGIDLYKSNFKVNKDKKKQKLLNYTLHRLPYSRYLEIVDYLRIKFGLEIVIVNPAFTSIIGRLKYSYQYKLNSHIAASYVIGRRALGFNEKPPSYFNKLLTSDKYRKKGYIHKSEWAKWKFLNKIITV